MDRIEKLKAFLNDTPDDNFLKHALALEFIKISNDREAEVIFNEILGSNPQYVGSYYHLGKLLERKGNVQQAIGVYEKGMEIAESVSDNHAYNELRGALEELSDV